MKNLFILMLSLAISVPGMTQDIDDAPQIDTTLRASVSVGLELQAYPTGMIPGFIIDATFNNANALILRLGYNWFNHRGLGFHDSEKGGGVGFSAGYRRYFEEQGLKGFFIGIRTDWWFNSVDWTENVGNDRNEPVLLKSNSNIIVFQPVVETGYKIMFKNNKASFIPTIGVGYESNISTRGDVIAPGQDFPASVNTSEETGQGFIVLAGFSFMFHISRDE